MHTPIGPAWKRSDQIYRRMNLSNGFQALQALNQSPTISKTHSFRSIFMGGLKYFICELHSVNDHRWQMNVRRNVMTAAGEKQLVRAHCHL